MKEEPKISNKSIDTGRNQWDLSWRGLDGEEIILVAAEEKALSAALVFWRELEQITSDCLCYFNRVKHELIGKPQMNYDLLNVMAMQIDLLLNKPKHKCNCYST